MSQLSLGFHSFFMFAIRRWLTGAALFALMLLGISTVHAATVFDNFNIYEVFNGPRSATTFSVVNPTHITKITTYHYNSAKGSTPGTISLKHADGTLYGPWAATGSAAPILNWYWTAIPVTTIKAGTYSVIDSGTASWSYNSTSGNAGFVIVEEGTAVAPAPVFNLQAGWNLVGNSTSAALNVSSAFGDSAKVNTVWKWLAPQSKWAFYTPTFTDGGAAYASSMNYEALTSVAGGEGFWVHAKTAFTAALPTGSAIDSASFKNLAPQWNLIATGDNKTPSAFNSALSTTTPVAGQVPDNLTSLWAWDAALAKWYFYAPSLEQSGGLTNYTTSHGYLDFASRALAPATGFWVNKAPSPVFTIMTNPTSGQIFSAKNGDGTVVKYFGRRDADGLPASIDNIEVAAVGAKAGRIELDSAKRPATIVTPDGAVFKLTYSGNQAAVTATSPDGLTKVSTTFPIGTAALSSISSQMARDSNSSSTGKLSTDSLAAVGNTPSNAIGSQQSDWVISVNNKCGAPYDDALLTYSITGVNGYKPVESSGGAKDTGSGQWVASIPGGLRPPLNSSQVVIAANKIEEYMGYVCDALGKVRSPSQQTLLLANMCTYIGAQAGAVTGPGGVAIGGSCVVASAMVIAYCSTAGITLGDGPVGFSSLAKKVIEAVTDTELPPAVIRLQAVAGYFDAASGMKEASSTPIDVASSGPFPATTISVPVPVGSCPSPTTITSVSPTSGPVGTPVSIVGSGFGATQGTLAFNGTIAGATSWSDTLIQTVVPTSATSGPVVVTNKVTEVASNGVTFTVTSAGSGTYTAFAGNDSKTEGMWIDATIANVRNWKSTTSLKYGTFSAESVGKAPVPITIKVETKPWSRVDLQVSLVIKSGNAVIFQIAPPNNTIPLAGGSKTYSYTWDPKVNPAELSIQIDLCGDSSENWVCRTITGQIRVGP